MSTSRFHALFVGGDPTLRVSAGASITFVPSPLAEAILVSSGSASAEWVNADGQFAIQSAAAVSLVTDDRSPEFAGATIVSPIASWVAETAVQTEASSAFSPDTPYGYAMTGKTDLAFASESIANAKTRIGAKAGLAFVAEYNKDVRLRTGGMAKAKWIPNSIKESRFSISGIVSASLRSSSFFDIHINSTGSSHLSLFGSGVTDGDFSSASLTELLLHGEIVVQGGIAAHCSAEFSTDFSYEVQPVKNKAFDTLFVHTSISEFVVR